MRNNQECRNLVVKVKRVPVNGWSKVNPPSNQQGVSLQEQCITNLFEAPSKKKLQITKAFEKSVTNLQRSEHESTIEPLLTDLPKGCKPIRVRMKRINKITDQIQNTEREFVRIQNTKVTKNHEKMKSGNAMKKGINVKTLKSCKESATFSKVNVKPNRTMLPNNQIMKENVSITNLVLTPRLRKSLNKLSLSKCSSDRSTIDPSPAENLHISRFSPIRNSTISDGKREKDLPHTNSKGERILKNVTNNPGLIEQLICSNQDSEEEHDQCEDDLPHSNKYYSKGERDLKTVTTNSDFIDKLICSNEASEKVNDTTRFTSKANDKTTHKFFQRAPERKLRSRKIGSEPENIFEFLYQSDTSESECAKHQDPAADIIKKLISEGKVRVATNQKGTGRPILKRGRLKTGRKQKTSKEKGNKTANVVNNKPSKIVEILDKYGVSTPLSPHPVEDVEDQNVSISNSNQEENFLTHDIPGTGEHVPDEGFSRLARSVLLQETRKVANTYKANLAEKRRLVEVARKFVSTPAANRQTRSLPTADLSPIKFLNPKNRPVCPSPWRINDDAHLPSVFNFTKNTSCLPTFSSDYIPPTPKKNKSNNSQVSIDSNITLPKPISAKQDDSSNVSRNTVNSVSNSQLEKSLESKNDSNVENKPPKALPLLNNDDNASIFNLRQLPNPRRTLRKRSPLKTINIIEVVSLPSWKKTVIDEVDKEAVATVTGDITKSDKSHDEDLFGFEEFLNHNSDNDGETNKTNVNRLNRQSIKRNLHKKLKDLQKWRPKNSANDNGNVSQKTCDVFDHNGPKQQLINEMLCSTKINTLKNDKQNYQILNEVSMCSSEEGNMLPLETDFFNDYEPETTFDKKMTLRTYVRPAKRKRKTRKNFVMFPDSEESNSDSEEELVRRKDEQKKRRHEAHSNAKVNAELESFVNEFNSMCKDVENYELRVE